MRRPPKFVHGFIDRHGRPRYYFRRAGFKRIPLPGLPWSPEFMAAYEAAAGNAPAQQVGAKRIKPGTVAAVVASYFGSLQFSAMAPTTRQSRRRILERFRGEHGDKGIATLGRQHVEKLLAAKSDTPGAKMNFLVALRALMRHAISIHMRNDDPTAEIKAKFRSAGFYSWSESDIEAFEARHPIGSRARLAFALLLFTAQRRADVVQFGRQHLRDGLLHVRQSKTGKSLALPLHPELRAILDATPTDNMTFLVTAGGKPFHPDAFTHWFKRRCREARLPSRASVHGLRKAACRRLAEAGCSASIIASISGHGSLREVARYTEAAAQARLAEQGIAAITRTSAGKPG